ncbi:3-ketoacyl-(acyl-carrier-protein) reductase [Bacillus sp. SG-1]|nr:3-ketoacyl-(acyl-carrier-protein) reductase [Bacillus sp. SG-1]
MNFEKIDIIHTKYPGKAGRKELLSLFREKKPCTRGKIRH